MRRKITDELIRKLRELSSQRVIIRVIYSLKPFQVFAWAMVVQPIPTHTKPDDKPRPDQLELEVPEVLEAQATVDEVTTTEDYVFLASFSYHEDGIEPNQTHEFLRVASQEIDGMIRQGLEKCQGEASQFISDKEQVFIHYSGPGSWVKVQCDRYVREAIARLQTMVIFEAMHVMTETNQLLLNCLNTRLTGLLKAHRANL